MNIGMILEAKFPPDIRVEREAKTLSEAGHTVTVMAEGQHSRTHLEKLSDYSIYRFDTGSYGVLKKLTRDYRRIRFVDPVWKIAIDKFVKLCDLDVVHVHDLPLVKTAHLVCSRGDIPVIADYHENYPAQVEAFSTPHMRCRHRFYNSYRRWAAHEEKMSHAVQGVITVAQEYKDHLIESHSVPAAKIAVIQNTFEMSYFKNMKFAKKKRSGELILSYIGSYGQHRGLDVVIRGMSILCNSVPQAKFIIIGKGRNRDALMRLAAECGVSSRIQFYDWVAYNELPGFFQNTDIGVIPHHASEHTNTTIPNKLFEYMFFRAPVLVSDLPPLKRIVDETGAGLYFKAGDHVDFARQVVEICRNPRTFGERGYEAVQNKYNWKIDGAKLVDLYANLERKIS